MKKYIYALFLCLCVIGLAGCGSTNHDLTRINEKNAFRLCRQADESGKLAVSYIFPVNSEEYLKMGLQEEEIKLERFFLATYVNALAEQYKKKIIEGVKISPCTYFTDVDGIGFSIIFDNLQIQNKFFGVDDEMEDSKKNQNISGFFFKKLKISTSFPFSVKSSEDYKTICKMALTSWCKENEKAKQLSEEIFAVLENSIFIYDFASTESKLKSDCLYEDENFVHNVFIKNQNQIKDEPEIEFWVTAPNVPVWYLSALVLVVAGMIVSYFILRNKKKK